MRYLKNGVIEPTTHTVGKEEILIALGSEIAECKWDWSWLGFNDLIWNKGLTHIPPSPEGYYAARRPKGLPSHLTLRLSKKQLNAVIYRQMSDEVFDEMTSLIKEALNMIEFNA